MDPLGPEEPIDLDSEGLSSLERCQVLIQRNGLGRSEVKHRLSDCFCWIGKS